MRLKYRGRSILFTGDTVGRRLDDHDHACKDAEQVMVECHGAGQVLLKSDVLLASHHGANNGNATCFIEAVDPQFVIFSSGHDHQHPTHNAATRVLTHGVTADRMFRTDLGDDESGSFEWKAGSIPVAGAVPELVQGGEHGSRAGQNLRPPVRAGMLTRQQSRRVNLPGCGKALRCGETLPGR